jgi:hypothetical protein
MIVFCNKCRKPISNAQMFPDPEVPGRTVLEVFCHGEVDVMHFDVDWMRENRDFMAMIVNDVIPGNAFVEDREYERRDPP